MKKSPHSPSSLPNTNHTLFAPRATVSDLLMLSPNFALHHHHKMVIAKRPWHFVTETISRDMKQNRSLDMRLIRPAQDSGTTICNSNSIHSPTSIPSFPRHYPRFISQYEQQQQKQKDFDENVQSTSMKPFYDFIPSYEQSNADQEQGASDRYESASDHGIDLSLKL
ncbi:unnamed protein product [Arabis nemorensis]|uniref:Uncharacterized protein n=1 Tax=Arabis nemorensis TaxID=586526 RepID=A0A565ANI8_9BRAS|nr:unnamed protein product [Arabis nemorensis]